LGLEAAPAAIEPDEAQSEDSLPEAAEAETSDPEDAPWADEPESPAASPGSEEELWARPSDAAEWSGVDAAGSSEASTEPEADQPYEPAPAYDRYGSSYSRGSLRGGAYAAAPLTLGERLSSWFAPAYGREFLWSYALLGVSTALAIYLGIAIADSFSGGGSDALPVAGEDVVREIACDAGPLSLDAGSGAVFRFDPNGLGGFRIDSVSIAERPASAGARSLVASVDGPASISAEAASATSATPRRDEYTLQILWLRGSEDAVTDCPLLVNVPASSRTSPAAGVDETPAAQATPEDEETPEPTP
jgi:hypothetical protein